MVSMILVSLLSTLLIAQDTGTAIAGYPVALHRAADGRLHRLYLAPGEPGKLDLFEETSREGEAWVDRAKRGSIATGGESTVIASGASMLATKDGLVVAVRREAFTLVDFVAMTIPLDGAVESANLAVPVRHWSPHHRLLATGSGFALVAVIGKSNEGAQGVMVCNSADGRTWGKAEALVNSKGRAPVATCVDGKLVAIVDGGDRRAMLAKLVAKKWTYAEIKGLASTDVWPVDDAILASGKDVVLLAKDQRSLRLISIDESAQATDKGEVARIESGRSLMAASVSGIPGLWRDGDLLVAPIVDGGVDVKTQFRLAISGDGGASWRIEEIEKAAPGNLFLQRSGDTLVLFYSIKTGFSSGPGKLFTQVLPLTKKK